MPVQAMGRGRKQTDPIMNLIYNPTGFIIIGQAPFGATNRTRRGEERYPVRITNVSASLAFSAPLNTPPAELFIPRSLENKARHTQAAARVF